jgi:hypothetical protein
MDLKLRNCGGLSWGDDYSRKSSLLRDGRAWKWSETGPVSPVRILTYVRMMCLQMGNDIDCRESAGSCIVMSKVHNDPANSCSLRMIWMGASD